MHTQYFRSAARWLNQQAIRRACSPMRTVLGRGRATGLPLSLMAFRYFPVRMHINEIPFYEATKATYGSQHLKNPW